MLLTNQLVNKFIMFLFFVHLVLKLLFYYESIIFAPLLINSLIDYHLIYQSADSFVAQMGPHTFVFKPDN